MDCEIVDGKMSRDVLRTMIGLVVAACAEWCLVHILSSLWIIVRNAAVTSGP